MLLQYHKDGLTQVQIAQRLGCDQKTISNWLGKLTDTSDAAKSYLRGQALSMAQNIVKKGRSADHIKALEGISVLAPGPSGGITVQIGVRADTVELIQSTFASGLSTVSSDKQQLSGDIGSDN